MKSTKSLNSLNDQSQRATKQKNTQLDSGQITIIPKPELTACSGDSLAKSLFGVTSAQVVLICPDHVMKSTDLLVDRSKGILEDRLNPTGITTSSVLLE